MFLNSYNHFHNILRHFDVLTNFPFTTSETMREYFLQTWYIRVALGVAELMVNWKQKPFQAKIEMRAHINQ